MKISYVLPVHNVQADIVQCLDSILKQKDDGELIVINDGSTDRTQQVIDTYKDDIEVLYYWNERKGGAEARNRGNELATNEIIAVCDCDIYYQDRTPAIKQFFKEFKEKSIFYSSLHLRENNNGMQKFLQEAYEWDFKSKCPISHPTVAYRREVAEKVKYRSETTESDLYEFFLLDANKEGFEFGACQDPLMLKVEGNSNRDVSGAKELKKTIYKEYGIDI